jgi:hypothetical protein
MKLYSHAFKMNTFPKIEEMSGKNEKKCPARMNSPPIHAIFFFV